MKPCKHETIVEGCRICFWCLDDSDKGRKYRALWNVSEPEPTTLRKAWSFVSSVVTHAFVGEKVEEYLYLHRLGICKGTETTEKCANYIVEQSKCQACGCNLGRGILDKARWKEQKCPVGKW